MMKTNANKYDARIEWTWFRCFELWYQNVLGTGGGGVIPELIWWWNQGFKPETKRTDFYELLEFYIANRNKYENEWDDDDNDNKKR